MHRINNSTAQVPVRKLREDSFSDTQDIVAAEEPLEILLKYHLEGQSKQQVVSVTMRTPGNDEELAAGFLFTEGIIQNNAQIRSVAAVPFTENKIMVELKENVSPVLHKSERNFYTTSSCGVCGKASVEAIKTASVFPVTADNIKIEAELLYGLPGKLREKQVNFNSTGGLHASGLFDLSGNFILLREDVGRHNALDKVIGAALREEKLPLADTIQLLSGRASFELIQKAMMAGIKIVAAIGAPSTLAVHAAEEAGITLIGFLKNRNFNIYTNTKRIIVGAG